MFNTKAVVSSIHNLYTFLCDWYIPLIFSDNIFTFYLIFGKNEKVRDFFISLEHLIRKVFYVLTNIISYVYINIISSTDLRKLFISFFFYSNLLFINISLFFKDITMLFVNLLSTIFFNFLPFVIFNFLFDVVGFYLFNPDLVVKYYNNKLYYRSNYFNNTGSNIQTKYTNEEITLNTRHQRFLNPIFKYDFKSGDYFPKVYKELYTYLFSTILDTTSGLRTAS